MTYVVPSPSTTRKAFPARADAAFISDPGRYRDLLEFDFEPRTVTSLSTGQSGLDSPTTYNSPVIVSNAAASWTGRFPSGGSITARWQDANPSTTTASDSVSVPPIEVNLLENVTGQVSPGSVRFEFNGRTYIDRSGDLVYDVDPETNAGTVGGSIDYATGKATITDWASGDFTLNIISLGSTTNEAPVSSIFFRAPGAPLAPASVTVRANALEDGSQIQATCDQNGEFDSTNIRGYVDFESGVIEVFFGEWVTASGNESEWWYDADAVVGGDIFKPKLIVPGTATFSAVVLTSIPIDPQILGLDPILLPSDGRVPIFKPGNSLMVVQRNQVTDSSPSDGATVDLGIDNVQWVRVRDANDEDVLSEHYTIDGPNGELQWANPLDLSAYTGPYTITSLSYFKRLCSDVQIDGTISLASGAPFGMATADATIFLASKLIFKPDGGNQDLQALVTNVFTEENWSSWSDSQQGDGTTGQYDTVNYPIEVANNGSITERWRLEFVSTTEVNVIGERFGQVLTSASISSDIAPNNPATGTPYFTIRADGWSGGWEVGNVLRFNTLGANDPVWLVRSTQPGDAPELPTDQFIAHLQGDVSESS